MVSGIASLEPEDITPFVVGREQPLVGMHHHRDWCSDQQSIKEAEQTGSSNGG
jgi:hypothetical protein